MVLLVLDDGWRMIDWLDEGALTAPSLRPHLASLRPLTLGVRITAEIRAALQDLISQSCIVITGR